MRKGRDRNARCPQCHKKIKNCSGHWQKWAVLPIVCIIAVCLVIFLIINNQDNQNITVQPNKSTSSIKHNEEPINPEVNKPNQSTPLITPSEKPIDPEKAKQARLLQKKWLEAAQYVVEQVNDKTANEIYEFILKNGVLCYPHEQGYTVIEDFKNKEYFFAFVPLLDSVKDIPELKDLFSSDAAGYFLPDYRALIIKESPPVSKVWRGLIILHEGYHAKACLTDPHDWNNPQIFYQREVDAHSFQGRLMEKIGGEPYQQCLQQELERIENTTGIKNDILQSFVDIQDYDPRLDEAFGASLSEYENRGRQINIWFAAMFNFLDKTRLNAYKAKAHFLNSLDKDE